MTIHARFAFDRSARLVDADGRLHVAKSHISKAAVNPYYGREIPGYKSLGLEPDKIYQLFRDPKELELGADSFARLPILSKHVPVTVDFPQSSLVIGTIGSSIAFDGEYLDADLCFWDAKAIAGIESKQVRELSCAYRYVPIMEPGEFEGEKYDGRMTNIRGNHLALVDFGRAGSDVVVADKNPFVKQKEPAMKMTKLGKALFAVLCMASPILAQDSAVPALIGRADRKTFKKDEVRDKLLELDPAMDVQKIEAALDSMIDMEQDPKPIEPPAAAKDASPADQLRQLLMGKVDDITLEAACNLMQPALPAAADDADVDDKKMAAAMDSLRAELRAAEEAKRDVRPTVGDVIGIDNAAEVYGFALDQMKIDRTGVKEAAALKALYKVASNKSVLTVPKVAQDHGAAEKMFPGLARFRNS